jgi:hypothetical protein
MPSPVIQLKGYHLFFCVLHLPYLYLSDLPRIDPYECIGVWEKIGIHVLTIGLFELARLDQNSLVALTDVSTRATLGKLL